MEFGATLLEVFQFRNLEKKKIKKPRAKLFGAFFIDDWQMVIVYCPIEKLPIRYSLLSIASPLFNPLPFSPNLVKRFVGYGG